MARCDRSNGRNKASVRGLAGNRKGVPEVRTPLFIATVKREFGVGYTNNGCWELLRSLGLSSQKPAKRAFQRDEEAIVTCRGKTCAGARSWCAKPNHLPGFRKLVFAIHVLSCSVVVTDIHFHLPIRSGEKVGSELKNPDIVVCPLT